MKPLRREMRRSGRDDPGRCEPGQLLPARGYFLRVREAAWVSVCVPEVLSCPLGVSR
jgi:hypothetical protein